MNIFKKDNPMKLMLGLVAIISFALCLSLHAQNLVQGGDFESGMGSWSPWFVDKNATWAEPPTADAKFSITSPGLGSSTKALYVQVNEPGKYDWYILISKSVTLEQNKTYELSFRAISDVSKLISVGVNEDISSGSPFFSQSINISQEDRIYGPFTFIYEPAPKRPGIKINFGGMPGNVTVDDVVIQEVELENDYTPTNSLEDIIGDMTLPHEGRPHGVPDSFNWSKNPRRGAQQPPEGWTAAIAWGQLYEWAEGNPATNTRVQIRDMEMLYLSKSDGQWHQLQKSLRVNGAAYVEDFAGDVNKPADIRSEGDGSISVTAGGGYNFHFWPSAGRVQFPQNEIEGCFVTVQCRLILDDPAGVDDLADARYLMSVGGDWWESMTAVWDDWKTNQDMGIGRFRFITSEWKGYNMITLPTDEVRGNPPPFAGGTGVDYSPATLVEDFQLAQNYPNPFNPTTTITYQTPYTTAVKLQVFDMTGREIATLVNGVRPAGRHVVSFDAAKLTSGIYFYRLSVGSQQWVRKMAVAR
ncbi:MAG: T9SS C-terminal target domain-containing protein [Calditrichaeota bacterium]|nr:MAG: T9SS C-terminal target domain-containing protein [Calditrichota bacterium]